MATRRGARIAAMEARTRVAGVENVPGLGEQVVMTVE